MEQFDGLSVSIANGWHSKQSSLNCDDDGVAIVDFWSVVEATVAS